MSQFEINHHARDAQPESCLGVTPAQAFDVMNRNSAGPISRNVYNPGGGGIVSGVLMPSGQVPHLPTVLVTSDDHSIAADWGQPTQQPQPRTYADATASVPDWNQHAQQGQARLNALDTLHQASLREVTGPIVTPGKGNGDQPEGVHMLAADGLLMGTGMASAYAVWAHPLVHKKLLDSQLKGDAGTAPANESQIGKLAANYRKGYLTNFSDQYQAKTELAKTAPQEAATKTHLEGLRNAAEEHADVLSMDSKELRQLRSLAGKTLKPSAPPTETEAFEKATRQLKFLDSVGSGAAKKRLALATAEAQSSFFVNHPEVFSSVTQPINWANFAKSMQGSQAFDRKALKPALAMAEYEKPIFDIGGKMFTRTELEFAAHAADPKIRDAFGAFGKNWLITGGIVGAQSVGQGAVAQMLHERDHSDLARLIEPNVQGVIAKSSALLLTPTLKGKALAYGAAQLLETETNMNHIERLFTCATGLGAAGIMKKIPALEKFAVPLALADAGIGLLSEVNVDMWRRPDNTLQDARKSVQTIINSSNDYSHSCLQDSVKRLTDIGKADPFLISQIFDSTVSSLATVNGEKDEVAAHKSKALMIVQQAQGESILASGLSSSQYQKLQLPNAPLHDNSQHAEDWLLLPGEHLDVAGQGSRALISALGSANMTEAYLAAQGKSGDVGEVEKQRQDIKQKLDSLFNTSHADEIKRALHFSDDPFSFFVPGPKKYSIAQFLKIHDFEYAHLYDKVVDRANRNYQRLEQFREQQQLSLQELQEAQNSGDERLIAKTTKFAQARQDALDYTTAYTAKLYRDAAFLKLGQVQNPGIGSSAARIEDAQQALEMAAYLAPENPDLAVLRSQVANAYNIPRTR